MSQDSNNLSFSFETGEIEEEKVKVLSVSDLNFMIKNLMEQEFQMIWLKAEISNFKAHTSGHLYFSLKDNKSQVSAVMFRGYTSQLKFNPKDGLEVLVRGRVSVYEPRGSYQVYVETMEPVGAGALQKAFEDLKSKLYKEGLFDPQHKKELPQLPLKIALITSPTGAAVKDMIQVLGRRHRGAEILILPSLTQGETAAASLIQSVKLLDQLDFDVAIIGRGGGSIEDMWCFNDEALARAIYDCKTPIVSAVGHEIDFTICDFVCDLRAPTPSAAAELVSKNAETLKQTIKKYEQQLYQVFKFKIESLSAKVNLLRRSLIDPKKNLADLRLKCDELVQKLSFAQSTHLKRWAAILLVHKQSLFRSKNFSEKLKIKIQNLNSRLNPAFAYSFQNKKNRFKSVVELLDSMNPLSILHRGFSVTRLKDEKGKIISDACQIKVSEKLWVNFHKGAVRAEVLEVFKK